MRQAVRSTKRLELFDLRVGVGDRQLDQLLVGEQRCARGPARHALTRHVEACFACPTARIAWWIRPPTGESALSRSPAPVRRAVPRPGRARSRTGPARGPWLPRAHPCAGSAGRDDARRVARHEEHRHAVVRIGVEVGHAAHNEKAACSEFEVKNFSPLMTQSSRRAQLRTGRRADPAAPPCGSVIENAENNSPSSSGCGYRARAAPACRSARSPRRCRVGSLDPEDRRPPLEREMISFIRLSLSLAEAPAAELGTQVASPQPAVTCYPLLQRVDHLPASHAGGTRWS